MSSLDLRLQSRLWRRWLMLALLLASLLALDAPHPALAHGRVRDLGTLGPDFPASQGYAINNADQVVGASWGGSTSLVLHAFVWTRAKGMRDLAPLGGSFVMASSINERGQVVGDNGSHAILWTKATDMRDLGPGWAYDINNRGQVVGGSPDGAFLWSETAGRRALGTLGGPLGDAAAVAINNAGQVAGWSSTGQQIHAFIWTAKSGIRDLDPQGDSASYAADINERMHVVGVRYTASGSYHAFLWTERTGMRDLGTLGGALSKATGINNHGQVVGCSSTRTNEQHAFLWTEAQGMRNLGAGCAEDINEHGVIVGAGPTAGGQEHAVLWNVPSNGDHDR